MSVQGGAPRATPCSRPRDAVLSETGPPALGRTLCYGDVTNQEQPNVRQNGQDGEVSEDELQRRQGWGSWEWVANAAPREGAGGGQGLWAGSRETRALLTPCSARARREDKGRPPARSRAGPEKRGGLRNQETRQRSSAPFMKAGSAAFWGGRRGRGPRRQKDPVRRRSRVSSGTSLRRWAQPPRPSRGSTPALESVREDHVGLTRAAAARCLAHGNSSINGRWYHYRV